MQNSPALQRETDCSPKACCSTCHATQWGNGGWMGITPWRQRECRSSPTTTRITQREKAGKDGCCCCQCKMLEANFLLSEAQRSSPIDRPGMVNSRKGVIITPPTHHQARHVKGGRGVACPSPDWEGCLRLPEENESNVMSLPKCWKIWEVPLPLPASQSCLFLPGKKERERCVCPLRCSLLSSPETRYSRERGRQVSSLLLR